MSTRITPNRAKITSDLLEIVQPKDKIYDINDTEVKGLMLRIRPNGDKAYFLRYRNVAGLNRTYKIANAHEYTPRKARDEAIKLLGAIKDGKDPQEKKREVRKEAKENLASPTLRNFLDNHYKSYVVTHSRTGDKNYKHLIAVSGALLDKKLKAITTKDVDNWKVSRLAKVTKSTIDRDVGGLRSAFRKALEWQLITETPFSHIKAFNEDNKRVRYLTIEEEKLLRSTLDARETKIRSERKSANEFRRDRDYDIFPEFGIFTDHLKPMVIISMLTGLRQGELFKLSWDCVDLKAGLLTVLAKTSKRDLTRHIPLSKEAIAVLKYWFNQSDGIGLVFAGKNGKQFTDVKTSWHKLLKDAGITDFHWHDLRHHFASKLVAAGIDLNTVRELMGHSDIKMTLRYAHLAPEHKRAAIDKAFG